MPLVTHDGTWSPTGWWTVCARSETSPESNSVQTLQNAFGGLISISVHNVEVGHYTEEEEKFYGEYRQP